ncbi:MAG: hypothetical protein ACP6IY_12180 [Promethearchaeia archaeon]
MTLKVTFNGELYYKILELAGKNHMEPEEFVKKTLSEVLNITRDSENEESIEIRIIKLFDLPEETARREDVIAVVKKMIKGKSYTDAVNERARERGVSYQTITDKCTRQLGLTTDQFKEKVKNHFLKSNNIIKKVKKN